MLHDSPNRKYRGRAPEMVPLITFNHFYVVYPGQKCVSTFPRCVGNKKGPNRRPCCPPEGRLFSSAYPSSLVLLWDVPDIFLYFIGNKHHFRPLQGMEVGSAPATASSSHSNTAAVAAASLWTITRQMLIREISERERGMIQAVTAGRHGARR